MRNIFINQLYKNRFASKTKGGFLLSEFCGLNVNLDLFDLMQNAKHREHLHS
jgi:hypothetical protein